MKSGKKREMAADIYRKTRATPPAAFENFTDEQQEMVDAAIQAADVKAVIQLLVDHVRASPYEPVRQMDVLADQISSYMPERAWLDKHPAELGEIREALEHLETHHQDIYDGVEFPGHLKRPTKITHRTLLELMASPDDLDPFALAAPIKLSQKSDNQLPRRPASQVIATDRLHVQCDQKPKLVEKSPEGRVYAVSKQQQQTALHTVRIRRAWQRCKRDIKLRIKNRPPLKFIADRFPETLEACVDSTVDATMPLWHAILQTNALSDAQAAAKMHKILARKFHACVYDTFCKSHAGCAVSANAAKFVARLKRQKASHLRSTFNLKLAKTDLLRYLLAHYDEKPAHWRKLWRVRHKVTAKRTGPPPTLTATITNMHTFLHSRDWPLATDWMLEAAKPIFERLMPYARSFCDAQPGVCARLLKERDTAAADYFRDTGDLAPTLMVYTPTFTDASLAHTAHVLYANLLDLSDTNTPDYQWLFSHQDARGVCMEFHLKLFAAIAKVARKTHKHRLVIANPSLFELWPGDFIAQVWLPCLERSLKGFEVSTLNCDLFAHDLHSTLYVHLGAPDRWYGAWGCSLVTTTPLVNAWLN